MPTNHRRQEIASGNISSPCQVLCANRNSFRQIRGGGRYVEVRPRLPRHRPSHPPVMGSGANGTTARPAPIAMDALELPSGGHGSAHGGDGGHRLFDGQVKALTPGPWSAAGVRSPGLPDTATTPTGAARPSTRPSRSWQESSAPARRTAETAPGDPPESRSGIVGFTQRRRETWRHRAAKSGDRSAGL